jgi:hypothetical protein
MRLHGDVVGVRHREHLGQLGYATHLGRAWLNEVDSLRYKQMLEIHQGQRVPAGGD